MLRTSSTSIVSQFFIDVADNNEFVRGEGDSNKTNLSNSSTSKKSTWANYLTFEGVKKGGGNIKRGVKATKSTNYLTPNIKKAFNLLQHMFTQTPILQYFDLKQYIRIKTDMSSYVIGGVLSQLTLDGLGQWYLVAYYLLKIILAKTWYKTHNSELLAIMESFNIWTHYLQGCKFEFLIFTDHNNLW